MKKAIEIFYLAMKLVVLSVTVAFIFALGLLWRMAVLLFTLLPVIAVGVIIYYVIKGVLQ